MGGTLFNAFSSATTAIQSVWKLGDVIRGRAIEDALGGNDFNGKKIPVNMSQYVVLNGTRVSTVNSENFPTIDKWDGRTVTSIKSMDLNGSSFQDPARVRSRARSYVREVRNFKSAYSNQGGFYVPARGQKRALIIAVPACPKDAAVRKLQKAASMRLSRTGKTRPTTRGEHGQSIAGFWLVIDDRGGTELERFDFTDSRLVLSVGRRAAPFHPEFAPYQRTMRTDEDGGLGQYGGNGNEYRGLRSTIERSGVRCRQYSWWMPTVLTFNNAHTAATETAVDPRPNDQCEAKRPSDGTTIRSTYKRFVGLTFVPIWAGRYMATIYAPGVGSQRAQYKGTAQLRWDYTGLPVSHVELRIAGGAPLSYALRDSYSLAASQPGRYEIELRLVGPSGAVLHTDIEVSEPLNFLGKRRLPGGGIEPGDRCGNDPVFADRRLSKTRSRTPLGGTDVRARTPRSSSRCSAGRHDRRAALHRSARGGRSASATGH